MIAQVACLCLLLPSKSTDCTVGCKSNAEYWEGIASSALGSAQIAVAVGTALWLGLCRGGGGGAQNAGNTRRDLNPEVAALVQKLEDGQQVSAVDWHRHGIVPVYHEEHDITVNPSPYVEDTMSPLATPLVLISLLSSLPRRTPRVTLPTYAATTQGP